MQEIDLKVVEAKAELSASLQRLGKQSQNNIPDSESSKDGSELNGSLPNIPTDPPVREIILKLKSQSNLITIF